MTTAQLENGLTYAEENFKDDNAPHLWIDKQLIKEKFDLTGKKVLDFGCGMGGMTLWYATNWDCQVTGLDIDNHHVSIAKRMQEKYGVQNVEFRVQNVLDAPLDEKYDYVFMNDVAEHVPYPVLKEIFQQLGRLLADGGRVFVTYPPWKSPYASHVTHAVKVPWCQFLPEKTLLGMIEKNNQVLVGDEESDLVEAYKGLNHLTHKNLINTLEDTGLKPVYRKSHCILNRLPGAKNMNFRMFPLDYLITKEFVLLEKK